MATASSRAETSHNHRRTSQLHAIVSCAKLKRKKSVFGAAIYVEVTAEGETRRTTKSHSSSNPKWDERLTLTVTPHTQVNFKVWSHHTLKADALLGKATLDLTQALEQHDRKLENVKEVLKLNGEQKGVSMPVGELTVYLDGLTVSDQEELAPLTNGGTANGTSELPTYVREVQQNGDAIHENGDSSSSSSRAANSTMNGADLGQRSGSCSASSGADGQVPSSSCSPPLHHVPSLTNGDATANSTPVHQPPDRDPDARMVNGNSSETVPRQSSASRREAQPSTGDNEESALDASLPNAEPSPTGSSRPPPASTPSPASSVAAKPADGTTAASTTSASSTQGATTLTASSSSSSSSPAPGEASASGAGGSSSSSTTTDGVKPRQQAPNAPASDPLPPG
ncbi:NEDD4-like E3 ubiquitin-protein ligase WWP1 isoform X1 [Cyprinodon tularosa]|uniref:NEDD4-like E3 ubiquitin-protein ligase WWP1 isoform X1 n=1 Tax=Cyprinodon tularosa TaxID=77115 RepID=UPI0018E2358E|nr:NEDD4-like E3 ubiquitin-protein ligase WWP1 isoform X1 [Cyprinodon tularosa]XP_038123455.1 NEDD4-like E3 ubiquitin-protein ligase WWP1 isoform X1 [Cyprinodon tularosa]